MKKQITGLMVLVLVFASITASSAAQKTAFAGVVNINTASVEEITQLSGIGKSKAEAIVAYRQAHPFKAVAELTEVKGIGPKLLEKIQGHVTVDGAGTTPSSPKPTASLAAPTSGK